MGDKANSNLKDSSTPGNEIKSNQLLILTG